MEEVGSSEAGSSGKVSLSEKVVLVLLALKAGAVKEGCGFLPSSRVLGRAITAGAGQAGLGILPSRQVSSRQIQDGCRFLKQIKGASTSFRVQILFMAVVARGGHGSLWFWVRQYLTSMSGLGSLGALQVGLVGRGGRSSLRGSSWV